MLLDSLVQLARRRKGDSGSRTSILGTKNDLRAEVNYPLGWPDALRARIWSQGSALVAARTCTSDTETLNQWPPSKLKLNLSSRYACVRIVRPDSSQGEAIPFHYERICLTAGALVPLLSKRMSELG